MAGELRAPPDRGDRTRTSTRRSSTARWRSAAARGRPRADLHRARPPLPGRRRAAPAADQPPRSRPAGDRSRTPCCQFSATALQRRWTASPACRSRSSRTASIRTATTRPADRAAAKAKLGLDPDRRYVANVARFHPGQGPGDAARRVRAWSRRACPTSISCWSATARYVRTSSARLPRSASRRPVRVPGRAARCAGGARGRRRVLPAVGERSGVADADGGDGRRPAGGRHRRRRQPGDRARRA